MSKPYLPEVLAKQVETWESEGYAVFHNRFPEGVERSTARSIVGFDIALDYPDFDICEYNTNIENGYIYIIVKCIKNNPHEKSKD